MLRDWGQDCKYHHLLHGYNYRMEGLQAAILRVKLRHLEAWTEARRVIVKKYNELLADSDLVCRPVEMPWARHVYHLYSVRVGNRNAMQTSLLKEGIQTGIHYAAPVHLQPAYTALGYGPGSLPESEKAANEVLSLPLYPEMAESQIQTVGGALAKLASRSAARVSS
jgi:dTDP-4-amino-4,6-dideoxygalactose transaminase